MGPRT